MRKSWSRELEGTDLVPRQAIIKKGCGNREPSKLLVRLLKYELFREDVVQHFERRDNLIIRVPEAMVHLGIHHSLGRIWHNFVCI
jgi:hypothetical protein